MYETHVYTDAEIAWELWLKRRFSVYGMWANKRPSPDTDRI